MYIVYDVSFVSASVYLDSPLGATLLNVYTVCNLIEKFVADGNMLWYIWYYMYL